MQAATFWSPESLEALTPERLTFWLDAVTKAQEAAKKQADEELEEARRR